MNPILTTSKTTLKFVRYCQCCLHLSEEGNGPALFAYLKADKLLVVVNDKTVDIYQYQ